MLGCTTVNISKSQKLKVSSPLLVLNLRLHIVDCVGGLDLEGDCLAREGLDEDLHVVDGFVACRMLLAVASVREA